ncbi:nucleoid DNA-binding protein [Elusimicrobium simillimum]|uniref:HU family DNA-binding protein n=1 Tax=Elusimicrobium simillimum TaxID=3143438 RepID=UPI003C6FEC5B
MKKEDIVNELAKHLLDKRQAKTTVDKLFDIIKAGVERDGKVTISNFGTFKRVKVKASVRHNPKTLQRVDVPEKTKIRFKPSPSLEK